MAYSICKLGTGLCLHTLSYWFWLLFPGSSMHMTSASGLHFCKCQIHPFMAEFWPFFAYSLLQSVFLPVLQWIWLESSLYFQPLLCCRSILSIKQFARPATLVKVCLFLELRTILFSNSFFGSCKDWFTWELMHNWRDFPEVNCFCVWNIAIFFPYGSVCYGSVGLLN